MMKYLKTFLIFTILLLGCASTACQSERISITPVKQKIYVVHISGYINRGWVALADSVLNASKGSPVIFHITSPGGGASESFLTNHGLTLLREKYPTTPIYVYVDFGLYSGGYLAALSLGKIVVAPSGMVGSVGVVMEVTIRVKADSMAGLKRILFRSGKMKWAEAGFYDLTKEQKAIIQRTVDYLYTMFIDEIIRTRKEQISKYYESVRGGKPTIAQLDSTLRDVCDGREYTPVDALKFGLIDDIKYIDALIEEIRYKYFFQNVEIVEVS